MSCGAKYDEEKHSRENLYRMVSEGVPEVTEESHSGEASCVCVSCHSGSRGGSLEKQSSPTDITHWPRGHMCPVRCQELTSGQWVRKRAQGPKEQGYNCLLHVWPSESHLSLQRSVSSSAKRVKYRIISSGCCREKLITVTNAGQGCDRPCQGRDT